MSHPYFLGFQIAEVVWVGFNYDRNILYDFQSVAFQPHSFNRVIGDESDFADTHFLKYLCSNAIFAFIGSEAQVDIGINGIIAFLL